MTKYEELKKQIEQALGKLTKRIVDWEREDLPDFNRSIEIFSELEVTLQEILSIIAERCYFKDEEGELPVNPLPTPHGSLDDYKEEVVAYKAYKEAQKDMLRAGYKLVKPLKKEAKD